MGLAGSLTELDAEETITLAAHEGPGLSISDTTANSDDDRDETTSTISGAVGTVEDLGYRLA